MRVGSQRGSAAQFVGDGLQLRGIGLAVRNELEPARVIAAHHRIEPCLRRVGKGLELLLGHVGGIELRSRRLRPEPATNGECGIDAIPGPHVDLDQPFQVGIADAVEKRLRIAPRLQPEQSSIRSAALMKCPRMARSGFRDLRQVGGELHGGVLPEPRRDGGVCSRVFRCAVPVPAAEAPFRAAADRKDQDGNQEHEVRDIAFLSGILQTAASRQCAMISNIWRSLNRYRPPEFAAANGLIHRRELLVGGLMASVAPLAAAQQPRHHRPHGR